MIQCVSDSNPHDDQPDWVELGEKLILRHTHTYHLPRTGLLAMLRKATGEPERPTEFDNALDIIQGLIEYVEEGM